MVVGPIEGEVRETYPGVSLEPEAQGAAGGYVAARVPLLVVPTLHGEDSVDGSTVSFAENLKLMKKEEEEKERRRKLREEAKRMRELDRCKKVGERLSAPDDDACRSPHWKRG